MATKIFAERLNHELDNMGVPQRDIERIEIFAKLFHIPRFKAEGYLRGVILPNEELLERIAQELEVKPEWLLGGAN